MRRAIAPIVILAALAGCGSPPTEREENLPERAPDNVAVANQGGAALNEADVEGNRAGIGGATQGPTAGDSDAPYAGEGSNSGN